jgi:hypothetical protein
MQLYCAVESGTIALLGNLKTPYNVWELIYYLLQSIIRNIKYFKFLRSL